MSERDELIKRLRKWECGIKFGDETGIPLDSIALLKLIADCLSALAAQQSQQEPTEPVAEIDVRNQDTMRHGRLVLWLTNPADLPQGTKLYTAPLSGVRAGMLRAAEICKEWEAKLSQGAGYAIRTAREAITRAADQVSQPDTVAVPIDALVALRSRDVMTRVMIDKHGVSISGWHVPQPAFSQFVPPAIFNILEPYDDHGGSVKAALTRAIQRAAQEAK